MKMKTIFLTLLLLISMAHSGLKNVGSAQLNNRVRLLDTVGVNLSVRDSNDVLLGVLDAATFAANDSTKLILATYDAQDFIETIRRTLNPYESVTYLPEGTPYTTPSITATTPTKILIPTTPKTINGFAFNDIGGGEFALQFIEVVTGTKRFDLKATTGILTGTNNTVITLRVYKNGVPITGAYMPRKVSSGSDVGSLSIIASFDMATNDYIEIYIESSLTSTVTFEGTSIIIREVN